MDWLQSGNEDRKLLYKHVEKYRRKNNYDWNHILSTALGNEIPEGIDYVSNFRSGRISRPKANQIYEWFVKSGPDQAIFLDDELRELNETANKLNSSWKYILDTYGYFKDIEIYFDHSSSLSIVGFATSDPIESRIIGLNKEFYFRLNSPFDGYILAIQEYKEVTYKLPLSNTNIIVKAEGDSIEVPLNTQTKDLLALSEKHDLGLHGFAFLFVKYAEALHDFSELKAGGKIALGQLDNLADELLKLPREDWQIRRVNLMFE